jgi:hypothetical protein
MATTTIQASDGSGSFSVAIANGRSTEALAAALG